MNILDVDKLSKLPHPLTAVFNNSVEYEIAEIDTETGYMQIYVREKNTRNSLQRQRIQFSAMRVLRDADGVEYDLDYFYTDLFHKPVDWGGFPVGALRIVKYKYLQYYIIEQKTPFGNWGMVGSLQFKTVEEAETYIESVSLGKFKIGDTDTEDRIYGPYFRRK